MVVFYIFSKRLFPGPVTPLFIWILEIRESCSGFAAELLILAVVLSMRGVFVGRLSFFGHGGRDIYEVGLDVLSVTVEIY